jgi:Tfp pilus assembly protein PilX
MSQPRQGKERHLERQEGMVLLMVLLLVLLFTGLGLLAMRHTQGELRSAASYMDSAQATEAAEAAVMMAATDMKINWDRNHACQNYKTRLCDDPNNGVVRTGIPVTFSRRFDSSGSCDTGVPDPGLSGAEPLAETDALSTNYAEVNLTFAAAERAPAPPGNSNDLNSETEHQTYGWFYITATSAARFGADPTLYPMAPSGRAQVTSNMKIGPIPCL